MKYVKNAQKVLQHQKLVRKFRICFCRRALGIRLGSVSYTLGKVFVFQKAVCRMGAAWMQHLEHFKVKDEKVFGCRFITMNETWIYLIYLCLPNLWEKKGFIEKRHFLFKILVAAVSSLFIGISVLFLAVPYLKKILSGKWFIWLDDFM